MERLVIKGFKDKNSHKEEKKMTVYPRNSKFKTTDEKRVKELEDKGYLKKVETAVPKNEKVETADKKTESKKAAKETKEGE